MDKSIDIILIFAFGLTLACVFAYIAHRLKLSPIVGYLVAGYAIGPYSPGYVADLASAEQLAEIGVILMLFGVGLHFKPEDLNRVKKIAMPGALILTAVSTAATAIFLYYKGWGLVEGVITGVSVGVSSTVILIKILSDNQLVNTVGGHIAVGWTIIEDFFTVIILLLLPTIAAISQGENFSLMMVSSSILFVLFKFSLLVLIMFTWGQRIVSSILKNISYLHSEEMFTLSVLALVFMIATGSAYIFGTSIPLGAFIAGMVIGKTNVRHRAAAHSLPFKDIFSIIFFLAVGMLFNPMTIGTHFSLFLGIFLVIILIRPLTAFAITTISGYPFHTALTVGLLLSQIGEFSFILTEEATKLKIIPDDAYDIIVACALISIVLNPIIFRTKPKGIGAN